MLYALAQEFVCHCVLESQSQGGIKADLDVVSNIRDVKQCIISSSTCSSIQAPYIKHS